MIKSQTILTITYPTGAWMSILTGKDSSSFRVRAVTGKVSRIRADTAKALIEEFDHLCNEGEASLTFIDDEAVATIRRHF